MSSLIPIDVEAAYASIDSSLIEWEKAHGIEFIRQYRDDAVRTFWLDRKVQIWVDPPDKEQYVKITAAELKESLPSKWGCSLAMRLPVTEILRGLEEAWSKGQGWL